MGVVPAALIFTAGDVSQKHMEMSWNLRYLWEMLGISAAAVLILAAASAVFTLRMVKRLEKSGE